MRTYTGAGLSGVMALMIAAAACGPGDNAANDSLASGMTGETGASAAAATATPTADFSQMSDANVASTVAVINGGEVLASELATRNASSADVKAFARDMVTEHTAMQKSVDSLAKAKDITPQTGPMSESIQNDMAAVQQRLAQMTGAAFDSAYINAQVVNHQQALDALNGMAMATEDSDMRAVIQSAIPKVQAHLDRARTLAATVGGAATTGDTGRTDTAADDTTRR